MKIIVKTNPAGDSIKTSMRFSKRMAVAVFCIVAVVFLGVAAAMYIGFAFTEEIGMLICGVLLTLAGVAFPVLVLTVFMPYIQRKQKEALEQAEMSMIYVFTEDGFKRTRVTMTETEEFDYEYSALTKVTETDKAFVLFTEKGEMRLPKSDIVEGAAAELSAHLKSVTGDNYYS